MRRTAKRAIAGFATVATLVAAPTAAFAATSSTAKDRSHETRVIEARTSDKTTDPTKDQRDLNVNDNKITAQVTSFDLSSKDKSLHDPKAKDASRDQRDPSAGGDIKK
jgi:hypothetical protein